MASARPIRDSFLDFRAGLVYQLDWAGLGQYGRWLASPADDGRIHFYNPSNKTCLHFNVGEAVCFFDALYHLAQIKIVRIHKGQAAGNLKELISEARCQSE